MIFIGIGSFARFYNKKIVQILIEWRVAQAASLRLRSRLRFLIRSLSLSPQACVARSFATQRGLFAVPVCGGAGMWMWLPFISRARMVMVYGVWLFVYEDFD